MRNAAWVWVVPLLLLADWLGARGLNADVIWGDEYHSIYDAGGAVFGPLTPPEIWARVAGRNEWHTPGFYFVLNGWGQLVGWDAAALRTLALLAGLLGIAWTYRLGRDVAGWRVGLLGAALLASSAGYLYYLHEIRHYVWFVPLTAFGVWAYLRIMHERREPRPPAYAALFVGAVSMLYMHYFATLPLMAMGVYHVVVAIRRLVGGQRRAPVQPRFWSRWWRVAGTMLAAGVLFSPWLTVLVAIIERVSRPSIRRENAMSAFASLDALMLLFGSGTGLLATLLLGLGVVGGVAAAWRRAWGGLRLVTFAVLVVGFGLLVNEWLRVLYYEARIRYLFAALPLLALTAGVGVAWVMAQRRSLGVALLIVWILTGMSYTLTQSDNNLLLEGSDLPYPMQAVAKALATEGEPGDAVLHLLPDTTPGWRYGGISDYYFWPLGMTPLVVERRWDGGQDDEYAALTGALADKMRAWAAYITDTPHTPSILPDVNRVLNEAGFAQCPAARAQTDGLSLALWARDEICCAPASPPLVQYGSGVALSNARVPAEVTATLPVTLAWSLDATVPPNTYSVALHVLDEDGALVAQTDAGLPHQRFACERRALPLDGLPPGAYMLKAAVYAWETGTRLSGVTPQNATPGDYLTLGEFTVRE